MSKKKPALGRGLSALLKNAETDVTSTSQTNDKSQPLAEGISKILISQIEVNPFQPRTEFVENELQELTESIKTHGIIQPITVRKLGYDKYQLISGERRFRASKAAGLKEVPAYIRIANDQAMLEMALIENIQRSELDAIEIAISLKRLQDECEFTQEQLGERVNKNRTTVSNYLRLLKLPNEVQIAIRKRLISAGHARAIAGIEGASKQLSVLERVINEKLSVRDVEAILKGTTKQKNATPKKENSQNTWHYFAADKIADKLSTNVSVKSGSKGKGQLNIHFKDKEDFIRISKILGVK